MISLESILGMRDGEEHRREPGVEANARLTAGTGLLLLVMLAAEGYTITSIRPLLPWHIAIGLALLPPVGLKLASTVWRFGHYYLGDPRYRRAGPPVPLLRAVGPVLVLSTLAVLGTGIAAWLAGPQTRILVTAHQASFVVWFAVTAVHVLGHTIRATRLAGADLPGRPRRVRAVPGGPIRQGLVLASLAAGVVVALATRGVASGWTTWAQQFPFHDH